MKSRIRVFSLHIHLSSSEGKSVYSCSERLHSKAKWKACFHREEQDTIIVHTLKYSHSLKVLMVLHSFVPTESDKKYSCKEWKRACKKFNTVHFPTSAELLVLESYKNCQMQPRQLQCQWRVLGRRFYAPTSTLLEAYWPFNFLCDHSFEMLFSLNTQYICSHVFMLRSWNGDLMSLFRCAGV